MSRYLTSRTVSFALSSFFLAALGKSANGTIEKQSFQARSQGTGEFLFTKLSSDETGLDAVNLCDDPEMWGSRYREYMGGSMGSGVAAGDFDGDGRVDLYVTLKTKPGRLYRNLGDWRFEDVTDDAGLAEEGSLMDWVTSAFSSDDEVIWRHGSVFADVNNDGLLDLFVCRNAATNLLYINQGDGTFEEDAQARGLDLVDGSVVGAFSDYDRDGWLDVLVVTNQMDGTEVEGRLDRLYRNTGDGYFVEVSDEAGISAVSFGHSAFWLDYDQDGWPDFYIANDYVGSDYLYRNRGDGTFENIISEALPHISYSSMGSDFSDINGDGRFDFLVADMAATSRVIEQRRQSPATTESALAIAAQKGELTQYARNTLFLNVGSWRFAEVACWAGLEATDWTWSLRFEDFDNDGWEDLHVTNGMLREANNADILTQMMRARSESQRVAIMKRAPRLEEKNLAYRNRSGEGFEDVSAEWGLDELGVAFGAATADFDQDGDLDLVYINHDAGLSVFRNDQADRNRIQVRLRGEKSNRFGVDAVLVAETGAGKQVRTLTPIRGYLSASELVAHFGLGAEESVKRLTVRWPSGSEQVFEDLEANFSYLVHEKSGAPVTSEETPQPLFVERAEELGLQAIDQSTPTIAGKEQALLPFRTDRRGPGIAVADVDGDGHDDVYLTATSGSPATLLMARNGTFEKTYPFGPRAPKVEDGPALFFDAEGDGKLDLLVTRASANRSQWPQGFQAILYSVNEDGSLDATDRLKGIYGNIGAACTADLDGDGDLDLFLGARSLPGSYPETPSSYILRNDGGRFVDISASVPGIAKVGLVKDALIRDLDEDGRPDLLIACEWQAVRYFRNEGNWRFSNQSEAMGFDSGGRGWWNSLATGDFNQDGRLDIVAGNLGLNTSYHAKASNPIELYYGQFGKGSSKIVIEAHYEQGISYPLRSRGELGAVRSDIYNRFPRKNEYAVASLQAVFGESELEKAELYRADSFESGVFLSKANGGYRFEPLPRWAQMGPIQGVAVSDFDGDGLQDIVALQNSDIAYPAYGGAVGTFLKGKKDGSFESLMPDQSGILIPDFARSLVIMDAADGSSPGLFLTQHGGPTLFYSNTTEGTKWIRIRLEGKQGNALGVGARICVFYNDGMRVMQEVGAGGSWMSQAAPVLYVAQSEERSIEAVEVRWPDGEVQRFRDFPDQRDWIFGR